MIDVNLADSFPSELTQFDERNRHRTQNADSCAIGAGTQPISAPSNDIAKGLHQSDNERIPPTTASDGSSDAGLLEVIECSYEARVR